MRFFLFCCCLAASGACAQSALEYNVLLIRPELLENAHAVVRRQEITLEVSGPGEALYSEKRVATIFNSDSKYNTLVLPYDKFKKPGKIKGKLYDAAGRLIRELEKSDVSDQSAIANFSIYEDNRVKSALLQHNELPYTVEFEYEMRLNALMFYPYWDIQDFHTSVENALFTVQMPIDIPLFYKNLNTGLQPDIQEQDRQKTYRWKAANLPAIVREPFAPADAELLPLIALAPGRFDIAGYSGSMDSWQSFGKFNNVLAQNRDALSPELKKKVAELCRDAAGEAEKIRRLYRYLQANTRYVSVQLGIGGWQPFDAQYVEENRFGDCKALSNFMKALLREAGIEAWPVLIYHGEHSFGLPADFALPYFNHMIVYVPGQDTWLECTSDNFPPGYLGSGNDQRDVLLLAPEGGRLARTPSFSRETDRAERHADVVLDADGNAQLNVRATLYGPRHEWYRYAHDKLPADELKKKIQAQNPLRQAYYEEMVVSPHPDLPQAGLRYKLSAPLYGSKSGKRIFVPLNAINAFRDVPAEMTRRVHPLVWNEASVELDTIVFQLPQGFQTEGSLADIQLDTEFGSYTRRFERTGDTLTLYRRFERKPLRLPAERYTDWRAFLKEVAKADGGKMVLVQ